MLEVQKFLNEKIGNGFSSVAALSSLTNELGIKAKLYPDDNMVLLDYDMISSPKSHPIVIECRSLILRLSDFSVLSWKFNRFFNSGECPEYYTDFDLSRSVCLEKSDGSLIGIYFNDYTNRWEISTRGMARAEGEHVLGGTFRELALKTMGYATEEEFQTAIKLLPKHLTYVMELCSPLNRVVKKYDKPCMVLLTVSDSLSLRELPLGEIYSCQNAILT